MTNPLHHIPLLLHRIQKNVKFYQTPSVFGKLNIGMMVGRSQGNGIDCLDQSLNAGTYWVTTTGGSTNLPEDQLYGVLVVLSGIARFFIVYSTHEIYATIFTNNKRYPWRKI